MLKNFNNFVNSVCEEFNNYASSANGARGNTFVVGKVGVGKSTVVAMLIREKLKAQYNSLLGEYYFVYSSPSHNGRQRPAISSAQIIYGVTKKLEVYERLNGYVVDTPGDIDVRSNQSWCYDDAKTGLLLGKILNETLGCSRVLLVVEYRDFVARSNNSNLINGLDNIKTLLNWDLSDLAAPPFSLVVTKCIPNANMNELINHVSKPEYQWPNNILQMLKQLNERNMVALIPAPKMADECVDNMSLENLWRVEMNSPTVSSRPDYNRMSNFNELGYISSRLMSIKELIKKELLDCFEESRANGHTSLGLAGLFNKKFNDCDSSQIEDKILRYGGYDETTKWIPTATFRSTIEHVVNDLKRLLTDFSCDYNNNRDEFFKFVTFAESLVRFDNILHGLCSNQGICQFRQQFGEEVNILMLKYTTLMWGNVVNKAKHLKYAENTEKYKAAGWLATSSVSFLLSVAATTVAEIFTLGTATPIVAPAGTLAIGGAVAGIGAAANKLSNSIKKEDLFSKLMKTGEPNPSGQIETYSSSSSSSFDIAIGRPTMGLDSPLLARAGSTQRYILSDTTANFNSNNTQFHQEIYTDAQISEIQEHSRTLVSKDQQLGSLQAASSSASELRTVSKTNAKVISCTSPSSQAAAPATPTSGNQPVPKAPPSVPPITPTTGVQPKPPAKAAAAPATPTTGGSQPQANQILGWMATCASPRHKEEPNFNTILCEIQSEAQQALANLPNGPHKNAYCMPKP